MTEIKETEVDGRRVVFLTPDGKLPPRVEETGTWGFDFRESRSGGASYLASLLTSAGVEARVWGRALERVVRAVGGYVLEFPFLWPPRSPSRPGPRGRRGLPGERKRRGG